MARELQTSAVMNKIIKYKFSSLVLSIFCVGSGVHAQVQSQNHHRPNQFRQVSPLIYAGGKPTPSDLDYLRAIGVKTIINLEGGEYTNWPIVNKELLKIQPGESPESIKFETDLAKQLGMTELSLPLSALRMTEENEQNVIKAVAILGTTKEPVYVHCHYGIDRTGLIISVFRVIYQNESKEKVLQDWEKLRHTRQTSFLSGQLVTYFINRYVGISR